MEISPKYEKKDGVIESVTFHKITEELDILASVTNRDLDCSTDRSRKKWMLEIRERAIKLIITLIRVDMSTESITISSDEIRDFRCKFKEKGVLYIGSAGWLAKQLGVSRRLVEAWEIGERAPRGPALKLLKLFMNLNQ